jgi:DNA topoisomerase-1
MSKTLVILESPGKVAKVQGYLGSNYLVKASVGHIRDIPMPKAMTPTEKKRFGDYGVDIDSGSFEALYKNSSDRVKVIKDLKDTLAKCDELLLLTDSDDEGSAIAWHLMEVLKPKVPTYRATTNEITQEGIDNAVATKALVDHKKELPKDFYGSAASALARGTWDRLYGFESSPYVWRAIKPGTSSGRVQTPGARLVVERELKRLAFKSVAYYSITGIFSETEAKLIEFDNQKIATGANIDDEGIVANNYLLITDDNLQTILDSLPSKDYLIQDVKQKPYRRSAPPPFTTSSGLQSIGGKTGMSSKQITGLFQALYTTGEITYIRTVSVVAAPEAITAARKSIAKLYGKNFVPSTPNNHKDKKAGNSGHECIRPVLDTSHDLLDKKFSDSKQQKVFDLIRKRMLASQAIDCEGTTWTAIIDSTDKKAKFSSSETEILEPGWTKIYQEAEELEDEK